MTKEDITQYFPMLPLSFLSFHLSAFYMDCNKTERTKLIKTFGRNVLSCL